MSADGGIPEQLVTAQVIDRLAWSPDGRQIAYATTINDRPTLQLVNLANRTIQRLATPGPALSPFSFTNDTIGYLEPFPGSPGKPNVNHVAFVRTNGESVPDEALRSLSVANGFAVISPDGRRLAGVVDPGGAAGSIWVADLVSGTGFQKMADLPFDVRPRGAAWTHDGDSLIVGTSRRTSHLVLFDQAK